MPKEVKLNTHQLVPAGGEGYWRCLVCQWEWFGESVPALCEGVIRYSGYNLAPPHLKTQEQLFRAGLVSVGPVRGCIYRPRLRRYEWLYDEAEASPKSTPPQVDTIYAEPPLNK